MNNFNFNIGKKRQTDDDELKGRESKNPRIEINDEDSTMNIDHLNSFDYNGINDMMINPQYHSQEINRNSLSYTTSQEDNELSNELNRLEIDKVQIMSIARTAIDGASNVAKNFAVFAPFINSFLDIGKEIIALYEKAEHNKELCGFLLKRCNFAMAEVQDLVIRKTEYADFFSKQENLSLFKGFIDCMKRIKKFIADVSQFNKLKKFLYANSIEENCTKLEQEFEGYMNSLNFSFALRTRNEFATMKYDMKQIKDLLFCVYGVSDDKQIQQNYFDGMDLVVERNMEFQNQNKQRKFLNSSEVEESEPLLDSTQYRKTNVYPSKRIGKRTSLDNCDEFCFKEFSTSSPGKFSNEQTQIEIRRQVNILKELKNSDHIIRFYGVAKEDTKDTKYYLVTEWMEYGNLHEYYTNFGDNINLEIKIKFALDICRGVAYLHGCKILHHDIQSANILVNEHHKVRIANFGLSKKFSDITRNISHNLENIRYMAPEKLLLDNNENGNSDNKKKKVPYDAKCEIYSVGALLWEIAELKKPHSDINSELIGSIRKRVKENYVLPFSSDVPYEWKTVVSRATEYEPEWRIKISDICIELYRLHKKYSSQNSMPPLSPSPTTITIPSVEEAVREHKSPNGNKRLAWQSFSYHSETDIEAKYWYGYYYYHEEIPELQRINKEERIRIAINIFKETADKGNPSAQLRYGMCLWKGEGVDVNSLEALKYLKMAANQGNSAAMYIIGKAYWNGGNDIEQDKIQGAEYLKKAANNEHPTAIKMCHENNIKYE
ncbi:hypothetical protein RclHR1_00560021 [Rhizophagus clarus]|uniref:Kinase-like domain-containing protein n=1 Tax=Rhizophagus clarus TaxID=94130 RepID=A0A2Z6RP64_9GLOM|nr:hypothetical protein RclHR1_00560021 [Rhizophagus clarus]GES99758.1 kinase-like domain-containing protein [Rhizophagus clarus]